MRNLTRGFTLIEILVALVIFSTVATVLTRLVITSQRTTTAQAVRAGLQSNLRVGSMVVPNELRMLNQSDSTDILEISDTSITYRAMRGYYVLCEAITSATSLKMVRYLPSAYSFDYRAPVANDSLFLFFENDTMKISDDRWVRVGISSTAAGTCTNWPSTGANTTALTVTLQAPGILNASWDWTKFLTGSPIRTFEITKLSIMTDADGVKWLGMCTGSSGGCTLEPVVGPLAATNGFKILGYNDANAAVTLNGANFATRNSLRSMRITFIGVGEQQVNRSGGPTGGFSTIQDTLSTVVTLRNVKQN